MPKPSPIDPIREDTEEYETAVLQALDAMDGGEWQEQLDAFRRFSLIFMKTIDWTYEQKVIASRYLAQRGRIEAEDWETVANAMGRFADDCGSPQPANDLGMPH